MQLGKNSTVKCDDGEAMRGEKIYFNFIQKVAFKKESWHGTGGKKWTRIMLKKKTLFCYSHKDEKHFSSQEFHFNPTGKMISFSWKQRKLKNPRVNYQLSLYIFIFMRVDGKWHSIADISQYFSHLSFLINLNERKYLNDEEKDIHFKLRWNFFCSFPKKWNLMSNRLKKNSAIFLLSIL